MGAELSKQPEEDAQAQQQQLRGQLYERNSSKEVLKEAPSLPQNLQRAVSNTENKEVIEKPSGSKSLNPHDHGQKPVLLEQPSGSKTLNPHDHGQKPVLLKQPSRSKTLNPHDHDQKPVHLKQPSLPQNLQRILKDADSPINTSSEHKLYDQLYSGVFLRHKTKKYWMNKKSNCNCFMLYARSLSITWGDTEKYWRWVPMEESSGTIIEVAELKAVCWLDVRGRFDTRKLSPGILYEVSFHVMLKEVATGWEVPINVRLVLPGGKKQEQKQNLTDKLRVRSAWIEIPVGKFVASAYEDGGEMEFSMYEHEAGNWKQGLLIKGVSIKPHSDDYKIAL